MKKDWLEEFCVLNPNEQLLVARIISKELNTNEKVFVNEDYDIEKSKIVRTIIENYITNIKEKNKLNILKEKLYYYETSSEEEKKQIEKALFKALNEEIIKITKERNNKKYNNEEEKEELSKQKQKRKESLIRKIKRYQKQLEEIEK